MFLILLMFYEDNWSFKAKLIILWSYPCLSNICNSSKKKYRNQMEIVKINFIDLTQSRITWGQNPNEGLWTLGWHLSMAVEDCHKHSVGGHSLLWVAPFPRQRVHTIYKWRNQVDHKQANKQHMLICFWLLLTVGVMGPAQIPALISCLINCHLNLQAE